MIDSIVIVIIKGFIYFLSSIPRFLWSFILIFFIPLLAIIIPARSRIALSNLKKAFPEKGMVWRLLCLLRHFYYLGLMFHLSVLTYRKGDSFLRKIINFKNPEFINDSPGKGYLILTAHTGNWEVAGFAHSLRKGGLTVVGRPVRNKKLEGYLKEVRAKMKMKSLPYHNSYFQQEKTLNRGEDLAYLIDHNALPSVSVFVPFFGEEASYVKTPYYLSKRTGCKILIAFNWWEKGKVQIEYVKIIERVSNPQELFKEYGKLLENFIKDHPEQWLWIHNRWKTKRSIKDAERENN